jgi:CHASE2 domain-containing sensor protein
VTDKIIPKHTLKTTFSKLGRLLVCPFKPKPRPPLSRFVVNFFIATFVIIGLYGMEDSLLVKEYKDKVLDWIMYWHSDFVPILSNNQEMQRMMLFEIDEQAFREFGSPVITPRAKLKALIEQAEKGGANVIAVDLELSWWSDGCIHEPGKVPACSPAKSTADEALAQYLQTLNARQDANAPLIILTRVYRYPLEGKQLNVQAFRVRAPSFLDSRLTEQKNVFWASTFFEVDDDRVRRRWHLASLVCQQDHLTLVPSMQLFVALAQLYATPDGTREAARMIRTKLKAWNDWANTLSCDASQGTTIPKFCQQQTCPDLTVDLPQKPGISDKIHRVDLAGGRETERVLYRFAPPDNPQPFQRSLIDKKSGLDVLSNGAEVDNKIVFIGVTHHASGDFHPIPIRYKEVDGVYVLANAVDTLLRFGQFQPLPWFAKLLISVGVIFVAILLFTWYGIARAFAFSTILVGVVLFVLSGQALHHGIWVDIALPMLTFQIIQAIWYILIYPIVWFCCDCLNIMSFCSRLEAENTKG